MRVVALCALILLLAPFASVAEEDLLAELDAGALEAVSDEELDSMRGGVLLHIDGLEIRMALGIQTSVDDQVLLRTELGVQDLQHADQFGTGAPTTAAVTAISEVPGALPTPIESAPFTGRETVLRTAGSLEGTQVHHVVGRHDLQSVVFNRLDGVSIQTVGEMQIEIGNFQQHQNMVNMNRAGSSLSNRMQDTATFR